MLTLIETTFMVFMLLTVMLVFALVAFKLLSRMFFGAASDSRAEETQIIQDVHSGLLKLEKRIEALETILLDSQKK